MKDAYLTLQTQTEATITEKRSRFLAFAMPVESEDEVRERIKSHKKQFYDARHVCHAYVLGAEGERNGGSDDGEPSGTAGRPILGQIRSSGLTNVLVIVVRYFGGIKLGTPGLIAAYKSATAEALACAKVVEKVVKKHLQIITTYDTIQPIMRIIKEESVDILSQDYESNKVLLTVAVRLGDEAQLRERISTIFTAEIKDTVV